jgi:hypothetical protein
MTTEAFVASYIHGCVSGALKSGDCGPVWQAAVILALLATAIGALVFIRLAAGRQSRKASVQP